MGVAKLLRLKLPEGAEVLSFSDLHFSSPNNSDQTWVEAKLIEQLATAESKPQVLVLNGDILELWYPGQEFDKVVKAHQDFLQAVREYANRPQHRVAYVVGNHDGEVAWNKQAHEYLESLGIAVCLELEFELTVRNTTKKIIFNHSNQLDEDNAFFDPFDQYDFPFGKYVVRRIIPQAKTMAPKLFKNVEHAHRSDVLRLVWSRIFYTGILPTGILTALVLAFSLSLYVFYFPVLLGWQEFGLFLCVMSACIVLIILIVLVMVAMAKVKKAKLASFSNLAAKKYLVASPAEVVGYITGHTHLPELKKVQDRIFANSGYGCIGLQEVHSRLGLPSVFVAIRHVSWCHLEWANGQLRTTVTEVSRRVEKARILPFLSAALPSRAEQTKTAELQIAP